MYIIKAINDGNEYLLHDLQTDDYKLLNCTSTTERNKTGEMSFSISPNHPNFDKIIAMKTEIAIYQDGEFLHSFRALSSDTDIYNIKTWSCEGELGFLNDSIQRYGEYHNISVSQFFNMIIDKHNADVDENKQFFLGEVNVSDSNDSLYRYAAYENSWDYINDKLINRLGGYIRTRHINDKRYIDYVRDYGNISSQIIQLGSNILDLSQNSDGSDIVTVLIPLGCKLPDPDGNETEQRLTINDTVIDDKYYGKDYIEDEEAIAIYGRIIGTVIYDDVTVPKNLYNKGREYLSAQRLMQNQLNITATDLNLSNKDLESFRLGDSVRVISKYHNIDMYLKIEKLIIDYNDPAGFGLTLGYSSASLTENINNNINNAIEETKKVQENINQQITDVKTEVTKFQSIITQTVNNIESIVSESVSIDSTLEQIRKDFSTSITQNSQSIVMNFSSQIQNVRDDIYENSDLLESYIRFRDGLIELGKVGNNFSTQLSNEELAFYEYAQKIAYISGTKLHIVQAEAEKIFTLGNNITGKYDFIALENGNLTFKWREV